MIQITRPAWGAFNLQAKGGGQYKVQLQQTVVLARVRLDIVKRGENGLSGTGGKVFTHVVSAAEIAAKQLLLPTAPVGEVIVAFVGGTTQRSNVDFQVTGLVLGWAGLSLELLLEAGDCISISYF